MPVGPHDIHSEFPEMKDAIEVLARENPNFAGLVGTYNRLTGKVEDLEEHDMPVSDFPIEDMKKQRVRIKDQIYNLLLAFRSGQRHRG